jgi:phage-related protein
MPAHYHSSTGHARRSALGRAVYVLHFFQKKTQKTSMSLAAQRYRDLIKELGQ